MDKVDTGVDYTDKQPARVAYPLSSLDKDFKV